MAAGMKYTYPAEIIRVVDGDTVDVRLLLIEQDLGFDIRIAQHHHIKLRLAGINAPEKNTPEGLASKAFLSELLPVGTQCTVSTFKDRTEKYGRYLALIWLPPTQGETRYKCLNDVLVENGMAKAFMEKGLVKPDQPAL